MSSEEIYREKIELADLKDPRGNPVFDTNSLQDFIIQHKHNTALKKITRGIGHQYNNIFMGLSGQLSILSSTDEIDLLQQNRQVEIKELIERGRKYTEFLTIFSRFADKELWTSPNLLVDQAGCLLNLMSRVHHFVFTVEGQCAKFKCNTQELILAIFCLGENAVEATEDGGLITIKLCEYKENEKSYCDIAVINEGDGLPQPVTENLFKPFNSYNRPPENMGIGLYTANVLVAKYNGTVIVGGEDRSETSVTLRIPYDSPSTVTVSPDDTTPHDDPDNEQGQKHIFLIVDDEEYMRKILLNQLQRRGHMVFCAASCGEAVEVLENLAEIISVVVIDVGLDEENGFICAEQLKQISNETKVVFMSGQDIEDLSVTSDDVRFIQKPFTSYQLEQVIDED